MKTVKFGACLALAAALAGIAPAYAQYPTKPVRFILPFPPGGGTDTLARILGAKLSDGLAQQVILDNRPGAGANIGAEIAAKSPPDGYTLLMGNIAHTINMTLYRKLNYNFVKDFAAVSLLASAPNIVVVHPSVPAKSVKELVALARARPGELDYASSGSGSSAHLAAVLMLEMTRTKMNHIPYKGGGPAVVALVSGEVSVGFATTPSVINHVKSGKLRALAVTGAKRSPAAPELPTVSEAGIPGYEVSGWYGILVPTGTPQDIISRLHAESVKVLKLADVTSRMAAAGFEPVGNSPAEFTAFIRNEAEKWAKVVKAAGTRVD
ncbi:MAG: tripartite tricarboxylate transporter substrate binding protein [Pseudomonadota bacterium]